MNILNNIHKAVASKTNKMHKLLLISIIVLVLSVLAGCKGEDVNSVLKKIGTEPMSITSKKLVVPNIKGGSPVSLSKYQGKLVVLSVWRSGCHYCNLEAPFIQELGELIATDDNIEIIGVSIDKERTEALKFIESYGLGYENGLDAGADILNAAGFDITGTPTTFYIDPSGKIIGKTVGYHEFNPQKVFNDLKTLYGLVQ